MSNFRTWEQQLAFEAKSRQEWLKKIAASGLSTSEAARRAGLSTSNMYRKLGAENLKCTCVYVVDVSKATPRKRKPKTTEQILRKQLRDRTKELIKAGYKSQPAMIEAARAMGANV